jgi:PKD repeat protein
VAFTDASTDPSAWAWDFGDGNTSTEQNPTNTYTAAGTYTVCLVVTNPCSADTICSIITVTACATPVASFTSSSSDLTVTFADASTNTTSWSWDFGDGNTSNSQNPTYSYSTAGTYNVCLTANSGCETDVMCDSVTVTACPAVIAAFTYADSALTINFTDLSVGADTWSWDFGDGFSSTTQNASHTYASGGTYTVCLNSSSSCDADSTCVMVTIVTVGIEESTVSELLLFPNPSQGVLTVQLSTKATEGLVSFIIHNALGEVVYHANEEDLTPLNFNGNQVSYHIDLRNLTDGVYLIQVLTENSSHIEEVIILK